MGGRVIWVYEEDLDGWRTPVMEVFPWRHPAVPTLGDIGALSPVIWGQGHVWHIHGVRLRKRDPDWRDVGFTSIGKLPVIEPVRPSGMSAVPWGRIAQDLLNPDDRFMEHLARKSGTA